ncbi:hypothetical protein RAB80_002912 [Fusarium oxysporum f. sp. vasinfectum]|nr:hypothetical protein RAB80_002912 [Fusarium oxysporum f. sp. vasinfectum]
MDSPMATETLEQIQTRHRRELKDLQGRITGKKKNATKKTRKGVNDECAEMERQLREKQAAEIASLNNSDDNNSDEGDNTAAEAQNQPQEDILVKETEKKRNRQKERLARRAAEQEAEAQRAEEEASTRACGEDIAPDGHCLFSAVADQLGQNDIPLGDSDTKDPAYKTVRRVASEYMLEHGDDFAPFLEEDLQNYARKMRDTAEWGGQLELMALARQYKAEIRVVQDGRLERIGEKEGSRVGQNIMVGILQARLRLGRALQLSPKGTIMRRIRRSLLFLCVHRRKIIWWLFGIET